MIFISYRISDALDLVGRLDADLAREFGSEAVFRDMTRLEAGRSWAEQLTENASTCQVMLVVIGATWQSTVFADGDLKGYPRLSDPDDWVRKEITFALDAGRAVVPVLLNGTVMPSEKWLARCSLDRLNQQGVQLRSVDYDTDYAKLVAKLRGLCGDGSERAVEARPPARPQIPRPSAPAVLDHNDPELRERQQWPEVKERNTVHGYKQFLADFPRGEHAAEAKVLLANKLRERVLLNPDDKALRNDYLAHRTPVLKRQDGRRALGAMFTRLGIRVGGFATLITAFILLICISDLRAGNLRTAIELITGYVGMSMIWGAGWAYLAWESSAVYSDIGPLPKKEYTCSADIWSEETRKKYLDIPK